MNRPTLFNWVQMVLVALVWGTAFMFVSIAIRGFGPLSVAAGRIGLGAVLLVAITFLRGSKLPPISGRSGRLVWLSALGFGAMSMAIPFSLLSWGQARVSSGFAGATMATVPLMVLPLAHVLVPGERMTPLKTLGFLIGFSGALMLIGLSAFRASGRDLEALARLACFAAAMSYASGSVITRLAPKVDPIAFAAASTSLAALIIAPLALWREGWPAAFPTASALAVLYLGAMPTALANLLIVSVVRSAGPSFLSLANYQVPLWSVIFGAVFLGERVPARLIPALALILGGVALSQWAQQAGRNGRKNMQAPSQGRKKP